MTGVPVRPRWSRAFGLPARFGHGVVAEHAAQRGEGGLASSVGGASAAATRVGLGGGGARAPGSPGRGAQGPATTATGSTSPVKSMKKRESRSPVEQPGSVVVRRPVVGEEVLDATARRRGCAVRASGSSPRVRREGSRPASRGWLVSPAKTPHSLTASQVPPDCSSRPPSTRGPSSLSTVMGTAGRSRNSSRLAPMRRGVSGKRRNATTSRHTGSH